MTLVDIIKLVLKHKVLLFIAPIIMASLAILLTQDPKLEYETQATVYTGIASGSSIEMDKKFDRNAIFTAFDNLISIITSRETIEEVGVRLLAQHLLMEKAEIDFISPEYLNEIKEFTPDSIFNYLVKSNVKQSQDGIGYVPPGVSVEDYEQTVKNLMDVMNSSSDNFVYELLNYEHPVYSFKAISEVSVSRVQSSDVVELKYKAGDPGICKQTLEILIDVCSKKYKIFKESSSDVVVQYFEQQLAKAENKLKNAESELLKYKQENNIINYYEQSKAVAVVREDMEMAYKNKIAALAGSQASKRRLERELEVNGDILRLNQEVLENKDLLANMQYKLVLAQSKSDGSEKSLAYIDSLQNNVDKLQTSIDNKVNELFAVNNSIDGIPMTKMMPEWIDNMVATENLTAEVDLMTKQTSEFLDEVKKYAPFGANIKRLERKIRVIEEEYLEILYGLNTAKIKLQDTQIAGNLVTIDPPYFPITAIPSKRKIIIVAAAFLSFVLILGTILVMEFFDSTLKNEKRATEKINLESLGMLPKITKYNNAFDFIKIQDRLMDFLMQNFNRSFDRPKDYQRPKVITIFSTQPSEGKTVIAGNIARKLKSHGKKVMYLNYGDLEQQKEITHSSSWFYRLFGYQDPRIDYTHPFLDNIPNYLNKTEYIKYEINDFFTHARSYQDLAFNPYTIIFEELDYVIVELPNIIEQNYPAGIFKSTDLAILICRSNRVWSNADNNIIENIKKLVKADIKFIINGVTLEETETLLGELPKKRSAVRKRMKNLFRLQFLTKKHI
jgi:uncharacterized protein involved in exopolysaccharide biosynthesis